MMRCETKIIYLFAIFIQISQHLCADKCLIRNLDNRLRSLTTLLADSDARWPENESEELAFCERMYNRTNEAKFFKRRCFKGVPRSLVKFTITALERTNILLTCKDKAEMNRFIKIAKCGNKGQRGVSRCWSKWIDTLNTIRRNVTEHAKVPLLCCSMYDWKECSLNVYRGLSKKGCTEDHIDIFDDYMDRSTIDPLNIIFRCHDQEEEDCVKLKKHMPKSLQQTRKNTYKTPLPSIMFISHYL